MGIDLTKPDGEAFAKKVMTYINTRVKSFAKEAKKAFNVEQIPGESVAVKFAQKDAILGFNTDWDCYGNQFVPLTVPLDLYERVRLDGQYSKTLSGGGITHLNVSDPIQTDEQMERLILFAIQCGCEHFAINYGFTSCEKGHIEIGGNSKVCPSCGGEVLDYYTRVIGYFTPVSSWNKVRREIEFPARKFMALSQPETGHSFEETA
jgi:ribonucleoside-triphosphate reductase